MVACCAAAPFFSAVAAFAPRFPHFFMLLLPLSALHPAVLRLLSGASGEAFFFC
jgi:hypothetical protein